MPTVYQGLFALVWIAWAIYWLASARNTKVTVRREALGSRLLHIAPLLLAAALLCMPEGMAPPLDRRFLRPSLWTFWTGLSLTVAGLLFCVWARRHIGANWSGTVTLKQDHELVRSGPYALVRHPIYTGLLLGFIGSALACGQLRGVLAVALVAWALWRKLRNEERWMLEQFGAAYAQYCRQVRALVPFVL